MIELACFKCGKTFEHAGHPGQSVIQPSGGLIFISHGNFGSRIFDSPSFPGDPHYLQIAICDDCIEASTEVAGVQKQEARPTYTARRFDVEELRREAERIGEEMRRGMAKQKSGAE